MIRTLIIEAAPLLLVFLVIVFIVLKVSMISSSINKNYFSLLFGSLLFYNRVTIRNTFHDRLKRFYQKSNRVNSIFYTIILAVIGVYILMKSI